MCCKLYNLVCITLYSQTKIYSDTFNILIITVYCYSLENGIKYDKNSIVKLSEQIHLDMSEFW